MEIKLITIRMEPFQLSGFLDRFGRAVNEAMGMGFDATTRKFVLTFDSAFEVQPILMLLSEKKIRDMMDFFVNKIGLKASDVARCPNVVLTSLEKRIIPRYSVLQGLMSKGLIKENFNMVWVFNMTKKRFEISFVTNYKNVAPEVMKAYEDQVRGSGVELWASVFSLSGLHWFMQMGIIDYCGNGLYIHGESKLKGLEAVDFVASSVVMGD
ncbi:hypothetical protein RJ639_033066 [Escallonia herrerae]|uniref:Uncharacterized protein n=1 Tax=Escallonia herrerae TaxID=1293975 RepID=A0AA88WT35_9ASTE|nr:hypothetical protein RJ639_033066 [Escallonia herrerae]